MTWRPRAAPGWARWRAPRGALRSRRSLQTRRRALRGDLACADFLLLGEVGLPDVVLDVVLGHRDRLLEDRGNVLVAVVDRGRHASRLLALQQRDGERGRRVALLLDRLVDAHALVAVEDVLDPLERRVLAGDRDLLELARLERRDGRVAEAVVGGEHAVDLVRRFPPHLLEDRRRLLGV